METIFEACQKAAGFTNADDTLSVTDRMRALREIESEPESPPISMDQMNEAELKAVLFHDPEISERRAAFEMLKLNWHLEAEQKLFRALRECRK